MTISIRSAAVVAALAYAGPVAATSVNVLDTFDTAPVLSDTQAPGVY